jgi:hypothetical protein
MAIDKAVDSAQLDSGLTDIADAIREKGGTSAELAFPQGFVDAIDAIPTGETPEPAKKDVNFYDYDGTLVYAYTLSEIQQMNALPETPTHEGLTSLGWNWTLEDLKAENAPMIVGANYKTTDGATKIYLHLDNEYVLYICLVVHLGSTDNKAATATIDWGDGTTPDAVESMDGFTAHHTLYHRYADFGDYVISISSSDNGDIGGGYSSFSLLYLADKYNDTAGDPKLPIGCVTKIEAGKQKTYAGWFGAFADVNMRTIVIGDKNWYFNNPSRNTSLYSNKRLRAAIIPAGTTNNGLNFDGDNAIKVVSIPNGITAIKDGVFRNCYAITEITIPNSVTSIGNNAFNACYSLTKVTILSGVTSIGSNAFSYCLAIFKYDFTTWTISDIDNCTFGTTIFNKITRNTKILFATAEIAEHAKAATNLATYAAYITYEGAEA